ncbi:MAG: MurR/RpiR family transcriptional regulator [Eubacteriales bacterium]|nr:MurR/RpiR family transcriptional regulator [Eubacteriales bacterium]
MDEQGINILERIHASYYQLTAAERKIADFVVANFARVQFMSITQLAEECGTAEATVSRFCRNLQLKGFNAFKLELARHTAAGAAPPLPVHGADTVLGRSRAAGAVSVDAVRQTVKLVDPAKVLGAVQLFEQAGQVLCIGSGGSMIMAQEFTHLFSTVSSKFQTVVDSHLQMSAVATMDTGGVLVLLSYSGATTGGLQILELAKSRGIPTVLVTRFNKSPAAKLADVVLLCGSNESPFQLGTVPAKIAQLVVMDILFQEYCQRNRAECDAHIQAVAAALSGMHI